MAEKNKKPIVGISIGDVNGIGPEVIIKTLSQVGILNKITPVVYGDAAAIHFYKKTLQPAKLSFHTQTSIENAIPHGVTIIECAAQPITISPGLPSKETGILAFKALEKATTDLVEQKIDLLVTAPLNKETVSYVFSDFTGHTEYIQQRCNTLESLMFLVNDTLRVGLVTNHVPLSEVSKQITTERIIGKLKIIKASLQKDFAIAQPKIAVLGLNPHAGDQGLLGKEELTIIEAAISHVNEEGIVAKGPFPADGFWGSKAYEHFDAVLSMYHDQGLIPFKLLSFGGGVNFTAGLPFIRTSPDHGTAYNIAGKGLASADSFQKAIEVGLGVMEKRRC